MPSQRDPVVLRSVEDLADARELRAAISLLLSRSPMNDDALRYAVWTFVGTERRAGVPPALVITRLTALIDAAPITPESVRLAVTRRVILWCVEEYFSCLGGNILDGGALVDRVPPLEEVRDSLPGSAR